MEGSAVGDVKRSQREPVDPGVAEEMLRVYGDREESVLARVSGIANNDAEVAKRCKPAKPQDHEKAIAENLAARVEADEQLPDEIELDMVHLPNHYARYKIEPIRFIVENLGPTFLVGNIIKYVMRYPYKNKIEDCRKAMRYAEMLVKFEEGNPDWWR